MTKKHIELSDVITNFKKGEAISTTELEALIVHYHAVVAILQPDGDLYKLIRVHAMNELERAEKMYEARTNHGTSTGRTLSTLVQQHLADQLPLVIGGVGEKTKPLANERFHYALFNPKNVFKILKDTDVNGNLDVNVTFPAFGDDNSIGDLNVHSTEYNLSVAIRSLPIGLNERETLLNDIEQYVNHMLNKGKH